MNITLLLTVLLVPTATANAEEICGTREQFAANIGPESRHAERPLFTFKNANGSVMEFWVNLETGTWTVLEIKPDNGACVIDLGTEFEPAKLRPNYEPTQHPFGSDPYRGYVRSNRQTSCCNKRDCAPAPYDPSNGLMQLPDGSWVDPRTHVNNNGTTPAIYFSFDDRGHACISYGRLVCAFIPGEGA